MSLVNLKIEWEDAAANLREKGELLQEALLAAMGELGDKLWELVIGNLSGAILQTRSGKLVSAVELEAAAFVGSVCGVAVEIPEDSPEWIIGMAHEYGGTGVYPIDPVNAQILAWMGPEGAVFAHHVEHPPALERAPFRSALALMEIDAVDQIKTTIAEVLAA
jgi:hypothetical protein